MPKREDIRSVLVIGSGPIVIGQAAEFDYSGTQAVRALKAEGLRVLLINSNPATIMTDEEIADRTYIEPLTVEAVTAILEAERPDAILPTMGGQTALNLALALHEAGVLEQYGVELIGAKVDAIRLAEDRQLFGRAMREHGLDTPRGGFIRSVEEGRALWERDRLSGGLGRVLPAIIRPSFTLGGTGGGVAYTVEEMEATIARGCAASPIGQVLLEESLLGWKEFELEVVRDSKDNAIIVCSIENLDPMGVHTGDSITVAPAQTLTDREYQRLRNEALKVIRIVGVDTGGSNIQFAIHPASGDVRVIEMNPRVSRSSALASKATGFPIAKIAAKLALGYTLDELPNDITGGRTPASFEPTIDYVVVKVPRFDFEKFRPTVGSAEPALGVQMQSVGEVMAFGRTFKEALQKALRSLETSRWGLGNDPKDRFDPSRLTAAERRARQSELRGMLARPAGPERIFRLHEAIQLGLPLDEIFKLSGVDPWFLEKIAQLVELEDRLRAAREIARAEPGRLKAMVLRAKQAGFSDRQIGRLWGMSESEVRFLRLSIGVRPVFKTVDSCAAEFAATTPYHYATYDEENESVPSDRRKVIILGSGPNRIGQGIEFDYCCTQGVLALKAAGVEAIMVNCNPETVSTDYDIPDKLYFEGLSFEDVMNIVELERSAGELLGVVLTFGGQTPLKLAHQLQDAGVPILGTQPEGIDLAEDRERFAGVLRSLDIEHPSYGVAGSLDEAAKVAERIGYPVLVRPSYVLGGRAMRILYAPDELAAYGQEAVEVTPEKPLFIDQFLEDAFEYDVDAVVDGEGTVVIGGIMEQIEEAGIHSGDSSCVLPPILIGDEQLATLKAHTARIARAVGAWGLLNIQFAVKDGTVYVIEANPRASRTIPFVSKTTGVSLARIAVRTMLGETLGAIGLTEMPVPRGVAVKMSVLPLDKFPLSGVFLGPEMRSTGEVMGLGASFGEAYSKASSGAWSTLPETGTVLLSLNDGDKGPTLIRLAGDLRRQGFNLLATAGTAAFLQTAGIPARSVPKIGQRQHEEQDVADVIRAKAVQLVINTPLGSRARHDEHTMGRTALRHKVPFLTTLSAAIAAVQAIDYEQSEGGFDARALQTLTAAKPDPA